MLAYIIRRLLLLPLTLFSIVLVNFVIINLAPGDPVSVTEISPDGDASRREDASVAFGSDERYLQFREHFGLTLPILFNRWPQMEKQAVEKSLDRLVTRKWEAADSEEMSVKDYDALRVNFGDRARFIMPLLLEIAEGSSASREKRAMAVRFLVRGGTQQGYVGPRLTAEQKQWNRKVAADNQFLKKQVLSGSDNEVAIKEKLTGLRGWVEENQEVYQFAPTGLQSIKMLFIETRFFRYLSKVVTLDFGTLRNDSNRTVISEVTKRFKYSLTLALLPMLITFFLCQFFGFIMALNQNQWRDLSLNIVFLILYATPVFVVAPFLIEKVALHQTFPFTDTAIPYSGFSSPEAIFSGMNSWGRLVDILQHIALPLVAVMYGSLATQSRLSRTAILEVLRQDYVRTAKAKGLGPVRILVKHVGRNAAITIVTSIAGSLGVILGGSLIIETIFGIDGFGQFFYEAIINRDYNVIMFSALSGAFLALIGYLVADVAYTLLDPRVNLD